MKGEQKLIEAFSKLSLKTSKYQPSTNPVLRITGGYVLVPRTVATLAD